MSAPPYIQDAYSWKANDGNYWSKNAKCAYPHINTFPRWWKVNLLAYYEIHRVIMYSNYAGKYKRFTLLETFMIYNLLKGVDLGLSM